MKRALLIGINAYPPTSGLNALQCAEHDARELEKVLRNQYGFETTLLAGSNATFEKIHAALFEPAGSDLFLFFFAGHGQYIDGTYRLHPIDSNSGGLKSFAFRDIADLWRTRKGYRNVLAILDACRQNARGGKMDPDSVRTIATVAGAERGRWVEVLYGCAEGQCSYEDPRSCPDDENHLGHGILTAGLLNTLRDSPGRIDSNVLAARTADWMRNWCVRDSAKRIQEATSYGPRSEKPPVVLRADRNVGDRIHDESVPHGSSSPGGQPSRPPRRGAAVGWWYADGDREVGPLSLEGLRGRISGDTEVWRPGLSDWLRASEVGELAGIVRPPRAAVSPPVRKKKPLAAGRGRVLELGGGVDLALVWIPPGEFMMGSPEGEEERDADAIPMHRVEIAQGFWMGKYAVTQGQWERVMGNNPLEFFGVDNPVDSVSWYDCQDFLEALSRKSGERCRLPTEAEWEYACRAGTRTPFHFGETISTEQANYAGNFVYGSGRKGVYRKQTTAVGSFPGNAWGLHDMHGNVWEWCSDWYDEDYYARSPRQDPAGPSDGSLRVLRGGSWYSNPWNCRSASRFGLNPARTNTNNGFRVVVVPAR